MFNPVKPRRGFTVTELLVVVGIIVVLLGLLLPALAGVWKTGEMTGSMNRLKQIATWMREYSNDNREVILPSRFDYSNNPYPGKVRSVANIGPVNEGSWTDILWTVYELNPFPGGSGGADYRFDSPDKGLYDDIGGWEDNTLRSSGVNSANAPGAVASDLQTPFGNGAYESGYPGFFAANNFFDSREQSAGGNGWFSTGQIKFPDRSMYLVDSLAGEIIEDAPEPYGSTDAGGGGTDTLEVDFRYGDLCLMLFLDGHIDPQAPWISIEDLEGDPTKPQKVGRRIRIRDLTSR